jgi:PAS domain S-box-containing protein
MVSSVRSPAIPYVVAIVGVAVAAVATRVITQNHGFETLVAPLFLVAVAFSAWFGGVGPGVTASLASFAAIALFFHLPDLKDFGPAEMIRVGSLLPVALFIGLLSQAKSRAEHALRERDARLQLVSEQIPGGLWSTDTDLRITSGFGAQSALLHGPAGTTLQQHFSTEDGGFAPIAAHRRALRGESSSYELEWGGRTFQSYVEPLRGLDGQIIGVVGIATDVTDRTYAEHERERLVAALETQHARLNAIVESIPAGIIVAEAPGGRIVLHNSKVEEVLKHPCLPSADVRGYGAWRAYHADGTKVAPEDYPLARGLRGEVVRNDEFVYHRGDGTHGWIRCSGAPIRDSHGTIVGSVSIFYDVDAARRAEEQVRQAKLQLEQANHAKDRFFATLSHELRTPLTPVLALASALTERGDVPAEVRDDAETIRRNVTLEARLIDDLLDITRISTGKLQLYPRDVDCLELIRQAADICAADGAQKGVAVELDLAAATRHHVHADPERLQQVFWNLIKNAIKFTPAGGRVTVRARNTDSAAGADRLRVEVADTGIGIDPALLPRIFDAFEQGAKSITQQFGGLGLGLAISEALVQQHGGTIAADSAGPGKGATFAVELRTVHPVAGRGAEPGAGGLAPARTLDILVVEDHTDSARVMARLLRQAGHRVETADTVAAARVALDARRVDLLISDLGLPDGSGHDLMADASRRHGVKGIALSGYGTEEDVQRSLTAGFTAHLTKPVSMATLRRAIVEVAAGTGSTQTDPSLQR